jgi:hypothetical protein
LISAGYRNNMSMNSKQKTAIALAILALVLRVTMFPPRSLIVYAPISAALGPIEWKVVVYEAVAIAVVTSVAVTLLKK